MWKISPAVFAVGKEYQIMYYTDQETTMWVQVGDRIFYDAVNGILRSNTQVHKVSVPMELLDREKSYTVFLRKVIDRKPYFAQMEEPVQKTYSFSPVPEKDIRAYHIADAHDKVEEPVAAAQAFGRIDLLILNGDIPNHCGYEKNAETIYRIASELTGGSIPVVFSRGNHDMRGKYAEYFASNTPCCEGRSYYTFRLGKIWGMVLDCGEDKVDGHEEYGHTICCHDFRQQETDYISQVIENASAEYEAADVAYKIVICHIPFTMRQQDIFNIETEIYAEWTKMLREHVKPDMILCGHMHRLDVIECGSGKDTYGQPCPVVIGSGVGKTGDDKLHFSGAGLVFGEEKIAVTFTDNLGGSTAAL